MSDVSIIGTDLAKSVFQLHAAYDDGRVAFRKQMSRSRLLKFLSRHTPCIIAMEACATSHYWGRLAGSLGHTVRLLLPIYVKPFAKRQKHSSRLLFAQPCDFFRLKASCNNRLA